MNVALWWKKSSGFGIFLREKPIELLLCLIKQNKIKYPSMLAKESKCTYSHTVHLLQKMEKADLVKFEKKGRLKLIILTKKGEKVADLFGEVGRALNK